MLESRLQGTSDEATSQVCEDLIQHGKLRSPFLLPQGFLRALQRPAPPGPLRARGDPENINPSNLKENCSPRPRLCQPHVKVPEASCVVTAGAQGVSVAAGGRVQREPSREVLQKDLGVNPPDPSKTQ